MENNRADKRGAQKWRQLERRVTQARFSRVGAAGRCRSDTETAGAANTSPAAARIVMRAAKIWCVAVSNVSGGLAGCQQAREAQIRVLAREDRRHSRQPAAVQQCTVAHTPRGVHAPATQRAFQLLPAAPSMRLQP
jgi:hypothetical protein